MPKAFAPSQSGFRRTPTSCGAALSLAGTALATAAAVLFVVAPHEADAQTRGSSGGGVGSSGLGSSLSRGGLSGGALSTGAGQFGSPARGSVAPSVQSGGARTPSAIGTPASRVPAVTPLNGGLSGAGALSTGVGQFGSPARGSVAPSVPSNGDLPPSAIGDPAPRAPVVAPLAPPADSTFLGSANTVVTTPGGLSVNVPSEAGRTQTFPGSGGSRAAGGGLLSGTAGFLPSQAPSTPGGGAEGVKACMGFWDAGTHMTKREWAAACQRVQTRLENLQKDLDKARSSDGGTRRTARARNR